MKGAFATLVMNGKSTQDRDGNSPQDWNGKSFQVMNGNSPQSVSLGELTSELMGTEISLNSETAVDVCRDAGWRFTGAALLVAALWMKAYKGDVNAAKIVRELNGEGPKEDGAVSLDSLSDAELYRMLTEAEFGREESTGTENAEAKQATAAEQLGAESDDE